MHSDNHKDSDESISSQQSKKQLIMDSQDVPQRCHNCIQLMAVLKKLTLENQNLTYQINFKDIALKKRDEMISFLSKDNKVVKEHARQLEMSVLVRTSTEQSESSKYINKSTTERGGSIKIRQQSLPKLRQQAINPFKIPMTAQYNTLMNPKETLQKKQITFQDVQKTHPILVSKESIVLQPEDNDSPMKGSENNTLNKKKSNTLIIRVNSTFSGNNDGESQRPSSQNEFALQQPSIVLDRQPSLSRNTSKSSLSPSKRLSSPYKINLKSKKLDFFDSSIYKSLEQLKGAKHSQERKFLEEQVRSIEDFAENIVREPFQVRAKIAEDIRHLLRDYIKVLDQSIVLKKAAVSNAKINRCFRAQEVINAITEEIMTNIECEHVIFYIKDQYNQQLWTIDKNNDNQMIKVDPKKGILMHTLNSEKLLRVEDVDSDPRFSKEHDRQFFKNIKNMLCLPIKDKQNAIRGLVQIINFKNSEVQVTMDEILRLLVENIGQQIISVLEFEQAVNNNNRVMKLMNITKQLNYVEDVRDVIKKAQELLTEVFLTPQAVVYLIKEGKICINSQENYPLNSGVVGEALSQMKLIETLEPLSHPNANFNVDIETILPVVSVPVITQDKQLVGVFQIVQDAYIRSNSIPREQIFYFESLQFFADLLAFNIQRSSNSSINQSSQQI